MYSYQGRLFASSPYHSLVASLQASTLVVRCTLTQSVVARKVLDPSFASTCKYLRFYQPLSIGNTQSPRLLLANATSVLVVSASSASTLCTLTNISHPSPRIAHYGFVSSDHVLVIPDFGPKATIYEFWSGLGTEIKDPKLVRGANMISIRRSGHVALLVTQDAKDAVVVLRPMRTMSSQRTTGSAGIGQRAARDGTEEVAILEASFVLETNDAQGLRWSPDGKWLALWDAPSTGRGVWVYTADGQFFRSWHLDRTTNDISLGVSARGCEWDESGAWLWCGMGNGRIIGLATNTFVPRITLQCASTIHTIASASVHQEQISATYPRTRSYTPAPLPAVPPGPTQPAKQALDTTPLVSSGITHMATSPYSPVSSTSFLAAVSASTPTTVHIFCVIGSATHPVSTLAVIIHHSPVRSLIWHPTRAGTLLIQCMNSSEPSKDGKSVAHWAYVWDESISSPVVVEAVAPAPERTAPAGSAAAKAALEGSWSWVGTQSADEDQEGAIGDRIPGPESGALVMLATSQGCVVSEILREENEHDNHQESTFDKSTASVGHDNNAVHRTGSQDGAVSPSFLKSSIPITGEGPEDAFDEGYSLDFSPVRLEAVMGRKDVIREDMDDTFGFKRGKRIDDD